MEPNHSHLPNPNLKSQSKTEQDEGFFSVLLDITKKHPLLFTVFFLEFLYTTGSIHKHFLTSKEWMRS